MTHLPVHPKAGVEKRLVARGVEAHPRDIHHAAGRRVQSPKALPLRIVLEQRVQLALGQEDELIRKRYAFLGCCFFSPNVHREDVWVSIGKPV